MVSSLNLEMALFRNLCICPVKCGAYFSGVNLRNYLFPLRGGTRNFLISLTLREIANFCIGNIICGQYRFMDRHYLGIEQDCCLNYKAIMPTCFDRFS